MTQMKRRRSMWKRAGRQAWLASCIAALAGLVACGQEPAGSEPPPTEPVIDSALTAAAAAVLKSPDNPDQALRAYQGEVERVLAQNNSPEATADLLELSTLSSLDAQTAGAMSALARTVDGRVFSASFATSSSRRGGVGLSAPLCNEDVDQARTIIYFVNGVGNDIFSAVANLQRLRHHMKDLYTPQAEFRLFYNASGFRTPEAECNYYGLALSDQARVKGVMRSRLEAAARQRCGSANPIPDFGEALVQLLERESGGAEPLLVEKLRDLVLADVLSGKKVLLVAHSQGNLYVEAALKQIMSLPAPDGGQRPAESVAAIAVASPITYASEVSSAFQNRLRVVQVLHDIIQAVPGAPAATVENEYSRKVSEALLEARATVTLVSRLLRDGRARAVATVVAYLPVFLAAYKAHRFDASYIGDMFTRRQLSDELRYVDRYASNRRSVLGQGFFQVTLTWNIAGDIDLHLLEPAGTHVYWRSRQGQVGELDRDDISGTGPENYFVCSPGRLNPGTYEVKLNNFSGTMGTQATVRIRAGTQFRNYTQVLGSANFGRELIDLVTIRYDADGSFHFSR
jgi:hypothetical protein